MIVKVQLDGRDEIVLVYDENHDNIYQGPITKAVRKLFGKDRPCKAYFHAELKGPSHNRTYKLGKRAKTQDW